MNAEPLWTVTMETQCLETRIFQLEGDNLVPSQLCEETVLEKAIALFKLPKE